MERSEFPLFPELPLDIQNLILSEEPTYLRSGRRVNRPIYNYSRRASYEALCSQPVTINEITRYLETGPNSFSTYVTNGKDISGYLYFLLPNGLYEVRSVMASNTPTSNFIYINTEDLADQPPRDLKSITGEIKISHQAYLEHEIPYLPDLISIDQILKQRSSCLNFNPRYVLDYLTDLLSKSSFWDPHQVPTNDSGIIQLLRSTLFILITICVATEGRKSFNYRIYIPFGSPPDDPRIQEVLEIYRTNLPIFWEIVKK